MPDSEQWFDHPTDQFDQPMTVFRNVPPHADAIMSKDGVYGSTSASTVDGTVANMYSLPRAPGRKRPPT